METVNQENATNNENQLAKHTLFQKRYGMLASLMSLSRMAKRHTV